MTDGEKKELLVRFTKLSIGGGLIPMTGALRKNLSDLEDGTMSAEEVSATLTDLFRIMHNNPEQLPQIRPCRSAAELDLAMAARGY